MAKELPYFQFEPAEYLTGDISFCSLSAQGLFTILCSYYWQRSCKLTKDQFLRRINHPKEFQELVDENIIYLEENEIKIGFLDAQLYKATNKSKTNSTNGSKGGRPKKQNPIESETKPKQNPIESETKGIREDKIKEKESNIYTDTEFIKDWNIIRTELTCKPSHLNTLNFQNKELFRELNTDKETMSNALKGFFKQKSFPRGQDYTVNPKHFLNHFDIYLQAYHDKNPNIWNNKNG